VAGSGTFSPLGHAMALVPLEDGTLHSLPPPPQDRDAGTGPVARGGYGDGTLRGSPGAWCSSGGNTPKLRENPGRPAVPPEAATRSETSS